MKRLKRVLLAVLLMGGALLSAGFSLRKRFRSQQVGPDEINAVAIMGGTEQRFSNQTFKGGYVRAIMVAWNWTSATQREHRNQRC